MENEKVGPKENDLSRLRFHPGVSGSVLAALTIYGTIGFNTLKPHG